MSHPSHNGRIGEPFIELFTIDSTNNYATARLHEGLAKHGAVYIAENQTAGKGQRGKSWLVHPGDNITMSCIMEPLGPNTGRPFVLSMAVALACHDLFNFYTNGDTTIKWPNDIYWRDRKAGGILIENIYRANQWQFAVAGMGMNINQSVFPDDLPNPVSLKQVTGRNHDRLGLAKELCERLESRYQQFMRDEPGLVEEYNSKLYKRGEVVRLRKDNAIFETMIVGVLESGELVTRDSLERRFAFGEVEFVLTT